MKNFAIALFILSIAQGAFAQQKSCSVDLSRVAEVMRDPTESADAPQIVFMRLVYGGEYGRVSVRTNTNQYMTVPEVVMLESFDIREDLTAENLNQGEQLIARAISISQDPIMSQLSETGLQLEQVRSVKVYTFGSAQSPGRTAVVEAFNSAGS